MALIQNAINFLSVPNVCLIFITVCLFIYLKNLKCHRVWREHGVPLLDPIPVFGQKEFMFIFRKSYFEIIHSLYEKAKGMRYCCIFQFSSPTLMFLDPQLIGAILTKDFEFFSERLDLHYTENHAISQQLFSVSSAKWKELSKAVSLVVSPGRISFLIKEMEKLERKINFDSFDSFPTVNINRFAFKFNEQVVGQATLGMRLKWLTGSSVRLLKKVRRMIDPSAFNFFIFYIPLIFPVFQFLSIPRIDDVDLCGFIKNIIPFRMKVESYRNDVLQFFIDSQTKNRKRGENTNSETNLVPDSNLEDAPQESKVLKNLQDAEIITIARRVFWFMAESQGTNSVALSFVLHLISLHPECQEEIRQELQRTLKERQEDMMTYQVVKDLKYTHTVVKECLRLYTPMSVLHRVCTKDYQIPDTSVIIPKGTKIIIPIYSIQRDPQYFPNPLEFQPSRFNDLTKIAPYTFMPFGEGPRFCIGFRFAMAHLKFTVASLVSKFHIEAVSTTQNVVPLHPLSPSLLRVKDNILVRFKKREDAETQ